MKKWEVCQWLEDRTDITDETLLEQHIECLTPEGEFVTVYFYEEETVVSVLVNGVMDERVAVFTGEFTEEELAQAILTDATTTRLEFEEDGDD